MRISARHALRDGSRHRFVDRAVGKAGQLRSHLFERKFAGEVAECHREREARALPPKRNVDFVPSSCERQPDRRLGAVPDEALADFRMSAQRFAKEWRMLLGTKDGALAGIAHLRNVPAANLCLTKLPPWVGRLASQMNVENEESSAARLDAMDRRVIQIDMSPTQAGITAALRRAFEAAAAEPCDRDFEELLRRLN